uniref:Ig-like domain-containing protein n=1 Tax=Tetranychus urticae TaxID=32264 RepID=T1JVF1_TETUR
MPLVANKLNLTVNLAYSLAPICKPDQQLVYPIGASEEALISCSVDADPQQISFKWFLNSSTTNYGINNYTVNETTSHILYSPKNRYGYGSIYCTSSNPIGHQKDPCSFNIIPPGVPEKVENCTMKNHSLTGLLVDCAAPLNGVSMPIYIIEVFKAKTREKILSLTNRDRPTFILQDLSPQDYYDLFVYSKTTGGQSDPVSLKASLSPSPMTHNQMKQDITREETYSPLLVILMAIVGIILFIIIMIILVIRIKSHRVEVTDRRQVGPSTGYYDESKSYPRITQKEKSLLDLVNIDKSLSNGDISCFQTPYDYHNIKQTIEMTLKQNKLPVNARSIHQPDSPIDKSYQLSSSSLKATLSDEHVRLRNLSTSLEDNGEKESKLSLISETCNQLLIDSVTAADCSDNELITDTSLMKNIRISCDGSEVTISFQLPRDQLSPLAIVDNKTTLV